MNYTNLRLNATNSFKNYKFNNADFNNSMKLFYQAGTENPSVALMLLKEEILKEVSKLDRENCDLARKISLPMPDYAPEDSFEYFIYKYGITNGKLKILTNTSKILGALKTGMSDGLNRSSEEFKSAFDNSFLRLYPRSAPMRMHILSSSDIKTSLIKKYSAE